MTVLPEPEPRFVVCIDNKNYPASLEIRKIYQMIPDPEAAQLHFLRVIDESGEDYLYPEESFVLLDLPEPTKAAILKAA